MSVNAVSGSHKGHHAIHSEKAHKSKKPHNSNDKFKTTESKDPKSGPKSKRTSADVRAINVQDELSLSKHGKKLGHKPVVDEKSIVNHKPVVNQITVNNTTVNNTTVNNTTVNNNTTINNTTINNIDNTTINNYYGGTEDSGGTSGSEGSESNTIVNVISPDLTKLYDRLDSLTKKLDDLTSAVANFEQLAFDFEARIGQFEQGEGPVVRGGLQGGGLSFDNYNFALSFAAKGFNIIDILKSSGGSSRSDLNSISDSLNRSLESLKSQSQSLLSAKNSAAGLFSNNLGTALNQAV